MQGFRRKSQIHGVAGLVLEINGEAGENGIHRFDPAEAPASMHAKAAIGQLHQRFDVVPFEFSRGRHFLKFFSHRLS